MAPEKAKGKEAGKSADIWSLACCIIEMLSGKPPWSEHGTNTHKIKTIIAESSEQP
jgi:serine/threonine protein kinase